MSFRATVDHDRVLDDLTPQLLDSVLRTANLVEIEEPTWGAEHRARAERSGDAESWRIEISAPGRRLAAEVPGRSAAYDVLRSWAAADGWWQEAFSWRPAG